MTKLTINEAILSIIIYTIISHFVPSINFFNILTIAIFFHVVVKEER